MNGIHGNKTKTEGVEPRSGSIWRPQMQSLV